MHFLQSRSCHTSLKDPIVLFCVHVQRFLVDGRIVLDLIHRCLSVLFLTVGRLRDSSRLLYEEPMGGSCRDGSRGWGRMAGWVGGTGLVVGLGREEWLVNMRLAVRWVLSTRIYDKLQVVHIPYV